MKRTMALLVACALLVAAAPLSAHHSTAMYNMTTPVTVTGTVKRFEWTNPHAFIYLEVKDDKGNPVEWEVEMSAPEGVLAPISFFCRQRAMQSRTWTLGRTRSLANRIERPPR